MSFRFLFRDFNFKIWGLWTRNRVFKKFRRERSVKDVIQCVRQSFLRPRRTLLLSVTAAFNTRDDEKTSCDTSISDEDLEGLLTELDFVEELSRRTLFCNKCGQRLVIGQRCSGVRYCACKDAHMSNEFPDSWVPYMEADDVIIWRKEYKHGQGLYAYKVYGRYKDVSAGDFAAVQLDGAYRRAWDAAVASLSLVEGEANGVRDQAVLHWEVLWPRLFANRDYVYMRRHKEFNVKNRSAKVKDSLFAERNPPLTQPEYDERPNVHSNAKRKAREAEMMAERRESGQLVENKVYVIVSRSCEHPKVPETKHAIRVNEYWSHMVVKTLDGADKTGMEFVLTYYDEPAVGGLPSGVAAWATGRAAPAYLSAMRRAACDYRAWAADRPEDLQESAPSVQEEILQESKEDAKDMKDQDMQTKNSDRVFDDNNGSKLAPCEQPVRPMRDASTQTEDLFPVTPVAVDPQAAERETKERERERVEKQPKDSMREEEKIGEDDDKSNGSWWKYLYPFYYFV